MPPLIKPFRFVAFGPKCKHCKFYLKDTIPQLSECKKYPKISEKDVLYEFA